MAIREYALPQKSYNAELLNQQLKATPPTGIGADKCAGVVGRKGSYWAILTELALAADEATCTTIATNHNAATLTEGQQIQNAVTINRQQIIDYCKKQLTTISPDTAAVKAQVKAYVDADVRLVNAITNIGALYGYNLTTNAGYLQAALILVALMT